MIFPLNVLESFEKAKASLTALDEDAGSCLEEDKSSRRGRRLPFKKRCRNRLLVNSPVHPKRPKLATAVEGEEPTTTIGKLFQNYIHQILTIFMFFSAATANNRFGIQQRGRRRDLR